MYEKNVVELRDKLLPTEIGMPYLRGYTVNIDLPKVEGLVSISNKVMFFVC